MRADKFLSVLEDMSGRFFTGVPDSLLMPLLDEIVDKYGVTDKHVVAANEGAAVGLAAGFYLATGRPGVVYMQNSGIGNAINPICSLLHEKVYAIPVIFVIGWRGEPGVKDEPQHAFQGEITLKLLELLEIPYVIISPQTDLEELESKLDALRQHVSNKRSVAIVVRTGTLQSDKEIDHHTVAAISREEALETILDVSDDFICVCSTGKLSREVFEIRERQGFGHNHDFLTVGSMGHSISIALGLAREKPDKRVLCLDGDGAALMHLGSLATAGISELDNLVHIVLNNGAHETVGGMPTACSRLSLAETAETLGYRRSISLMTTEDIMNVADFIKSAKGPAFIEVICNTQSRGNLGRPTTTPADNKKQLMEHLRES